MIMATNDRDNKRVQLLLSTAKRVLDCNPLCSLGGTLMLYVRGISLGRIPADIDILIPDYPHNIVMPIGTKIECKESSSEGSSESCDRYEYKGIMIDVLANFTEPDTLDGFKVGTVEDLLQSKYQYSQKRNSPSAIKHYLDLLKLDFKFPSNN